MKILVNSQLFAQELRLVNRVAPAKAAIATLTHVLLSAENDNLHLYTTDLEISLCTPCLVVVKEPGTLALPAARLLAMVDQFPNGDVTIATEGNGARITCGAFTSKIQALPTADFPPIPPIEGTVYTLVGSDLRRLIAQTRYAINEGSSKYFLQGALLTLDNGIAACVTTDGKQVALSTMGYTGATGKIILPVKTLDMLAAQPELQTIEMTVGERHLFFSSGGRLIISRMLEGQFPNYERIIPRENIRVIEVDRYALSSALRRVGLVAGESAATSFVFSAGSLELSASSAQIGESVERVPIVYNGETITICTSWELVLAMLNVSNEPTTIIHLKDKDSPLLILDGSSHMAVIVPIRG